MRRIATLTAAAALAASAACGPFPTRRGAFRPTECRSDQFEGDLSNARAGQFVTYVSESNGGKTIETVKIVGKAGSDWLVEHWTVVGMGGFGYLFRIGDDRKVKQAWAAAKDDTAWTAITVKEPAPAPAVESSPPRIRVSDETKEVRGGTFACRRVDATVRVLGKDSRNTLWFSLEAPAIFLGSEHGGIVAMEASGSRTWLEARGEDARPTLELPED